MPKQPIKNVFIDANIWLSLFHFTNDDLEQFSRLKEILGSEIRLFVPEQVRDEVYRNRENKLKDSLNKFEKFDLQFPVFFKNYPEYEEFHNEFAALKVKHKTWLSKVKQDIAQQTSPADIVLNDFFCGLDILPVTEEIVHRSTMRYDMGNPPGKDKKYGDAINWEILLESVPDTEDLFFISADKDYASIYDDKQFNPFLAQEWHRKKHSDIVFFKSLVDFLKKHVADIELGVESEKDELIERLAYSRSFSETHSIIKSLSIHSDWTIRQIQDMCEAAIRNRQVEWILGDDDVFQFFGTLLETDSAKKSSDEFIETTREKIEEHQKERSAIETAELDDLPF